jgi:hypothetical protein
MYISKPLRWKHLELSEKKIKNQQEKKNAKNTTYFVHNLSPLFWHQPFHNLVRLFPVLFWGQPIDSAVGGLAVFVNKINNLATQSWKKNSGLCFIENNKKIWPELSKQCYNLSCTMCRMDFLSNILTWLILPGPLRIKLFAYILLWDQECVLSFTYLSLRPNKF